MISFQIHILDVWFFLFILEFLLFVPWWKNRIHLILSGIIQEAVDLLLKYSCFLSAFLHLYTTASLFSLVASVVAEFVIKNLGKQFIENWTWTSIWRHVCLSCPSACFEHKLWLNKSFSAVWGRTRVFRMVSIAIFHCTCCWAGIFRYQYQISKYFSDI